MVDARVDAGRLSRRLEQLASIGRDSRGGLSRFAYTPDHAEACQLVARWILGIDRDELGEDAAELVCRGRRLAGRLDEA